MSTLYPLKELGKVARFEYGKSQVAVRSLDGAVPVYGTGGLLEYANACLHPGPSVIVGRKGSLGNPIYADGPFWAVDTTYYAAECTGRMRWLHYVLCSLRLENYNEATGVPSLARPTLNGIRVPLPSPDEQDAIVRILSLIDQAIEQTEALLAKEQRIKTGLMHDLLTRGLDAQGVLRDPSTHSFKNSLIGDIPNEWDCPRVADCLLGIEQGWSPDCADEPAALNEWGVLKTTAVVWEGFSAHENKTLPLRLFPKVRFEIKRYDVLMTRAGPNSRVGVVAYVAETRPRLLLSDKIYRLIPKPNIVPEFLALALSAERYQRQLSQRKTGMAESQTNISQEIVQELRIQKPDTKEQEAIVKRIRAQQREVEETRNLTQKLCRLKTGLMQDLLTGHVPVTPLLLNRQTQG